MIITPYSGLSELSTPGSVATNFPRCKWFFTCDNGSGNSIAEAVTNTNIATGGTLGWATANAVTSTATIPVFPVPSVTLGTKAGLLLFSGSLDATVLVLTYSHGEEVFVINKTANNSGLGDAGSVTAYPTIDLGTTLVAAGIGFKPGTSGECTVYKATLAAASNASANGSSDIAELTEGLDTVGAVLVNGTLTMYGLAFFAFASGSYPADISAAIAWMHANWVAGNKEIYPGWKGLT